MFPKAFVDAYNKNDVSIIEPYLINPISYSCQLEEGLIDKGPFLKKLSDSINSLHECGKIEATIIPAFIRNKNIGTDILLRKNFRLKNLKNQNLIFIHFFVVFIK